MWDLAAFNSGLSVHSVTTNWCYPSLDDAFTGPPASKPFEQCLFNRNYLNDNLSSYDFYVLAGHWRDVLDKNQLADVLALIKALAKSGKPVLIMAAPKQFDNNVLQDYQQDLMLGRQFLAPTNPTKDKLTLLANQKLSVFSERFNNVSFIARDQLYQVQGNPSDLTARGIPYSLEGTHLSIYGSKAAAPNLIQAPAFKNLISELNQPHSQLPQ